MPNTASAKKSLRVSARKTARNAHWQSRIENLRRKFHKAVAAKNSAVAQEIFQRFQKVLDAAAQRNVVHANTAARTTSRFARALGSLRTP